jgi:hypothetical protein
VFTGFFVISFSGAEHSLPPCLGAEKEIRKNQTDDSGDGEKITLLHYRTLPVIRLDG